MATPRNLNGTPKTKRQLEREAQMAASTAVRFAKRARTKPEGATAKRLAKTAKEKARTARNSKAK